MKLKVRQVTTLLSAIAGEEDSPSRLRDPIKKDHQSQLKLGDLPRTFREAIQVTRRLGFCYLWVDSLCILQDDEKDWKTESARMQQYYTNSRLTIAAADGSNSNDGLFRDRDRLRYQACELEIRNPDGSPQKVYASTNSMSFEMKRSSLSPSFKASQLYSRAWVLQEQLLSPRTLSYFRDRIAWRCQEVYFDERAPFAKRVDDLMKQGNSVVMGRNPRYTDWTVIKFQKNWVFPPQPNLSHTQHQSRDVGHHEHSCYLPEERFYLEWGDMVREYTERSMTFNKEKLIALDAIVDAVAAVSGKAYLAGI